MRRVIYFCFGVPFENIANRGFSEESAADEFATEELFSRVCFELASKPRVDRDAKAHLWSIQHFFRENLFERFLEDILFIVESF